MKGVELKFISDVIALYCVTSGRLLNFPELQAQEQSHLKGRTSVGLKRGQMPSVWLCKASRD